MKSSDKFVIGLVLGCSICFLMGGSLFGVLIGTVIALVVSCS